MARDLSRLAKAKGFDAAHPRDPQGRFAHKGADSTSDKMQKLADESIHAGRIEARVAAQHGGQVRSKEAKEAFRKALDAEGVRHPDEIKAHRKSIVVGAGMRTAGTGKRERLV